MILLVAISIQPRKVAPFAVVATAVVPDEGTTTTSPLEIALSATVTLPRVLSKLNVTFDSALEATNVKLLITNLLVVVFFSVVMVTIKLSPACNILPKEPEVPPYTVPSIFNSLTDVALQLNERVDVASDKLEMVIVAVFADAPIPKKPFEPFAVTVTAPSDILLSLAPETDTVTPSIGVCVPVAAYSSKPASMISSRVLHIYAKVSVAS